MSARIVHWPAVALVATVGCASLPHPAPPTLPPPTAPLEARVSAYDDMSAAVDGDLWAGLSVHHGRSPEAENLGAARTWLSLSPEAASLMSERATFQAVGITLLVLGMVADVVGLSLLPTYGASDNDFTVPLTLIVAGLVTELASIPFMNAAQQRAPQAVTAYNRWLWEALGLPPGNLYGHGLTEPRTAPSGGPSVAPPW